MNYTRVFAGSMIEGEQDIPWMKYNNTLAPRPGKLLAPWSRGNIPGYHNGGNKFNLACMVQRNPVSTAQESGASRDIFLEVIYNAPRLLYQALTSNPDRLK